MLTLRLCTIRPAFFAFAACWSLTACFSSTAVLPSHDDGGPGGSGDGAAATGNTGDGGMLNSGAADGAVGGDAGPCVISRVENRITTANVDKVDLLFVVDDSPSMREEHNAIKDQIPRMITTLVTGMRPQANGGVDPNPFPPVKDLHLGVVSVNMGIIGIQGIPGCSGVTGVTSMVPGFGDDGILRDVPPAANAGSCTANFPAGQRFLSYTTGGAVTTAQLASDFACVAVTGTSGCGFEQQLESPLKALWPSIDIDANTGKTISPNRITFLTDTAHPMLALGHGDLENHGFLRNSTVEGLSLIGILMFTDEEDCSSKTTVHFTPQAYLNMGDPLYNQDLNLRCFYNQKNLYDVARYINGFKALRAGNENLVVFAAITGVPPDLVDDKAYKAVSWDDDASRDAFYKHVLSDPRMIPKPDATKVAGAGNLALSCDTPTSKATPPQRIVQVAQGFGRNGLVRSLCDISQFQPSMDGVINTLAKQLGGGCLPSALTRDASGTVSWTVEWELPVSGLAPAGSPTQCSDLPFLGVPAAGEPRTGARGGKLCVVKQLAVTGQKLAAGDGWYYDDFSAQTKQVCQGSAHRIAFTPAAKPPKGVLITLVHETKTHVSDLPAISGADPSSPPPHVGSLCAPMFDSRGVALSADEACSVQLTDASGGQKMDGIDRSLVCDPIEHVCVQLCAKASDCPTDWSCAHTTPSVAHCVNPTCGAIPVLGLN